MDWNFVLSIITIVATVVTAVVAIVAVVQTQVQIKVSNKQHLFDMRVAIYLTANGLVQLYKSHSKQLEEYEFMANDLMFTWLTNNSYLEQITPVIKEPLKQPEQKEFLCKLESLKELSAKITFSFSGTASAALADFVLCYQELLLEIYQYQIIFTKMQEMSHQYHYTLEECQEKIGEKPHRDSLLAAIKKLQCAYQQLEAEKVEEHIKKQIKL